MGFHIYNFRMICSPCNLDSVFRFLRKCNISSYVILIRNLKRHFRLIQNPVNVFSLNRQSEGHCIFPAVASIGNGYFHRLICCRRGYLSIFRDGTVLRNIPRQAHAVHACRECHISNNIICRSISIEKSFLDIRQEHVLFLRCRRHCGRHCLRVQRSIPDPDVCHISDQLFVRAVQGLSDIAQNIAVRDHLGHIFAVFQN